MSRYEIRLRIIKKLSSETNSLLSEFGKDWEGILKSSVQGIELDSKEEVYKLAKRLEDISSKSEEKVEIAEVMEDLGEHRTMRYRSFEEFVEDNPEK